MEEEKEKSNSQKNSTDGKPTEKRSRFGTLRRKKKAIDNETESTKDGEKRTGESEPNSPREVEQEQEKIDLVPILESLSLSSKADSQLEALGKIEELVDVVSPAQLQPFVTEMIQILKSGKVPVQVRALKALRKILGSSEFLKEQFSKQNGLQIFLKLLSDGKDKELLDMIGSSMGYIVSPETTDAFCDAGAVPILIKQIKKSKSEKMKGFLIAALYTLTNINSKARSQIESSKGIPVLFKLVKEEQDEFLQEQAMGIIRNIMIDSSTNQDAVRKEGGFELFKEMLKAKNPTLVTETCSAIEVAIASNEANQKKLANLHIFDEMIPLLSSKAVSVKVRVALILSSLVKTKSPEQKKLCELGIDPLIEMLKGNALSQEAGASALNIAIADNEEGKQLLAKKGVLNVAVNAFATASEKVQEPASTLALTLLPEKLDTKTVLFQGPSVTLIGSLLQSPSPVCQMNGMKLLHRLSVDNSKQQGIIRDFGNINNLVPLLDSKDTAIVIQAASTIEVLAENNPKVQVIFRTAGALTPLISMLETPNVALREKCCTALVALVTNNFKNQQTFQQSGGIAFLINLLNSVEESSSKEALLKTLSAVVYRNSHNQASVQREGGIRTLIRLLSLDDQPRVQEEATNAVIASCIDYRENQDAMRMEGGLDFLIPLLCTRIVSLQMAAAKCIAVLATHNTENQDKFLEEGTGTVESLQDIVWSPNKPLRNEVKATLLLLGQTPIPQPLSGVRPTRRNTNALVLPKPVEPEPQKKIEITEDTFESQANAEKAKQSAKKKKKSPFDDDDDDFFHDPFKMDRYGGMGVMGDSMGYGNMSRLGF